MRTILICTILLALAATAHARTPVYGRTKCIGLYCWIVEERVREPMPATWCIKWKRRVGNMLCARHGWIPP